MPMGEQSLLTYTEVAERFGITRDAARMLAKRKGWKKKQPNSSGGMVRVEVPESDTAPEQVFTRANGVNADECSPSPQKLVHPNSAEIVHPYTGPMVPMALMDQRLAEQIARHDAEMARRLAERDSLHLGHIERLMSLAAAERSLFLERVDAAELRAESAEARAAAVDQKLHEMLERLMERQTLATQAQDGVPWWARWFGATRKSDLRR